MRIVVVTGIAGSGKTTALRALEDLGFYAIDNLPIPLFNKLIALGASSDIQKLALVIDARAPGGLEKVPNVLEGVRKLGHEATVVFLDAEDASIQRRFSETRRRHPLSPDGAILDGIAKERAILAPLHQVADRTIDTTNLSVHELKQEIQDKFAKPTETKMSVTLSSFGYRHGVPSHADLVFDVRFLPNPHFVEALRPLTGLDSEVARYVLDREATREFLEHLEGLLRFLLPEYEAEGKAHLHIAIGCTGGQHRSVALATHLATWVGGLGFEVKVRHRDLPASPPAAPKSV